MIIEVTVLRVLFEILMLFDLIPHVSIKTQMMEEVIALEHAMIGDHPMVLF